MSASREDVEVTLKAIEEAKRLGPFVKGRYEGTVDFLIAT